MEKRGFVDLGFTTERIPVGTHTCLFYQEEALKNRIILQYVAAGIRNGEKVVCLMDSLTKEAILDWFRTEQVKTNGYDPERGLTVESTRAYFPAGSFLPEEMIERWREYTEVAMAEGFKLLRVTGEVNWLAKGIPGAERFVEYEQIINARLKGLPLLVLCQFDIKQVSGANLMDLLFTHPMVIANGQVLHNPLFQSRLSERRRLFRPEKARKNWCERISAVLLIVTALLKTLPTLEKKAEFTSSFLETVFHLKDYYLYLAGYTVQKGIWAESVATPAGTVEEDRLEIRTAGSVFGYLLLPPRGVIRQPRLRSLLLNYLNLLALSLESTSYKEGLERANQQLKAEITERKKIEQRLRQNEQWVSAIMEGTDEGLWEWDATTGTIKYDQNWQRILGYQPGEVVFHQEWFRRNIHPQDWPVVDKAIHDYLKGEKKYIEAEFRFKTKSGAWKRVWSRGICLAKDAAGNPLRLSGTNWDFTLYHQTEEALQASVQELAAEKERSSLLKMQKLESLGILASGIAHDFNNLLAAILSNVQLAAFKWEKGLDGRKDLHAVEKAILKAAKLTKQLMAFAKGGAPIKQPAKLANIIKETAEFALRGATVKCQYLLPSNLWPVEIDGDQISQVIQNLMLNAYHAMPDGGVIRISAHNVVVSPQNRMGLRPGNYVRVEIEDQGTGIPAEMISKIFDPYFTTKKEGNGLGLSTSYYIIQNHDGYLGVQSRMGEGSTFYFYLPATERPVVAKKGKKASHLQGKGKVLLMDDEPLIRASLQEYLEGCGYETVVVKDGAAAVALYTREKKNQAPFDVVILDLTVPGGMGGERSGPPYFEFGPGGKGRCLQWLFRRSGYVRLPQVRVSRGCVETL
ncbi:MAG TPA: PAS domain-containing protein [Firmicutes bacterium]|nr:PAS domain-containing protein [Bacillota bacterium]